ncbi:hypothetical protein MPL3365_380002 [Mesorhizobium plurifarium]|uniref:Uncharacterized protein n=1 Tax=Mesorhizobium plurifarium TaxID=69974 RepID=A0A090GFT3_MESPL|nr:hypothetical protein MPL3365_380002 [Mesorhizobium plurifarium]
MVVRDVEGDCDLPTASERDSSVGPAKGLLDLPIRQGASFRAPGFDALARFGVPERRPCWFACRCSTHFRRCVVAWIGDET